jgi:hypothetical protein
LFVIPETPFADNFDGVKLAGATALCGDDGRCADWPIREPPLLDDVFPEFTDSADTNDFSLSEGVEPPRALLSVTREGIAGSEGPSFITLHGNLSSPHVFHQAFQGQHRSGDDELRLIPIDAQ